MIAAVFLIMWLTLFSVLYLPKFPKHTRVSLTKFNNFLRATQAALLKRKVRLASFCGRAGAESRACAIQARTARNSSWLAHDVHYSFAS